MSAAIQAVFALLTALWNTAKARRAAEAASELPRGDEINSQIDADVAELERLAVGAEAKP